MEQKVYHFALSKTNSTYIAEETVQRVFIKLWHNLQTKDLDIPAEVQLFTISRSVLLDVLKEENRRYAVLQQFPEQATAQQDLTQIEYKDLLQEVETYRSNATHAAASISFKPLRAIELCRNCQAIGHIETYGRKPYCLSLKNHPQVV